MNDFPHLYRAYARGSDSGSVKTGAQGAPAIETWPPPQFDGPAGHWSPEGLLVAAIADCFVLSFRAVARASRLEWDHLDVQVEGMLDRVDGVTRFTRFTLVPALALRDPADTGRAQAVLEKAKRVCLVTNSLAAECELALPAQVVTRTAAPAAAAASLPQ